MEVYISINGVLRNFIQKFEYHYQNYFLETDEKDDTFEYRIVYPIQNDNILNHFIFQSKEEYEHFSFIEFPLEIFGHAAMSYPSVIYDLNKLIYEYPDINFTIIGLDELAKAKSSTLFFLSKNSFLGNNIRFIKSNDIDKEWKKCDIWVTDNADILFKCPKNKTAVKFITDYNQYYPYCNDKFPHRIEINNLTKIKELCLKYSEKNITSTLTKLLKNAAQIMNWTKKVKI